MKKHLAATIVLGITVFLSGAAAAEENLMRISPEMRLKRGDVNNSGDAVLNVTITKINTDSLPELLKQNIKGTLMMCGEDPDRIDTVRSYAWTSAHHVDQGLGPNFIVEFTPLPPKTAPSTCMQGKICDQEGCLLQGYVPVEANSWKQDFELRSLRLGFPTTLAADGINHKTALQILSYKADCKEANGTLANGGCLRNFDWRNFGLRVIPPSQ